MIWIADNPGYCVLIGAVLFLLGWKSCTGTLSDRAAENRLVIVTVLALLLAGGAVTKYSNEPGTNACIKLTCIGWMWLMVVGHVLHRCEFHADEAEGHTRSGQRNRPQLRSPWRRRNTAGRIDRFASRLKEWESDDGAFDAIRVGTAKCPVCATETVSDVTYCANCKTAHHQECWEYMESTCGTFGCGCRKSTEQPDASKLAN